MKYIYIRYDNQIDAVVYVSAIRRKLAGDGQALITGEPIRSSLPLGGTADQGFSAGNGASTPRPGGGSSRLPAARPPTAHRLGECGDPGDRSEPHRALITRTGQVSRPVRLSPFEGSEGQMVRDAAAKLGFGAKLTPSPKLLEIDADGDQAVPHIWRDRGRGVTQLSAPLSLGDLRSHFSRLIRVLSRSDRYGADEGQ
jgi:hypothetical protein